MELHYASDFVFVQLTMGRSCVVDVADLPLIEGYKWRVSQAGPDKWYACTTRDGRTIYMHRLLMGAPKGALVDHRDNDGLNNRRKNLRVADKSLNGANSSLSRRNKSGVKGVQWYAPRNKWRAAIRVKGKTQHIGYYHNIDDAAQAYANAAREVHGEFANPVFQGREDRHGHHLPVCPQSRILV